MGKKLILALSVVFLVSAVVILSRTEAGKATGIRVADEKKIEKIKQNTALTDADFSLYFEGQELPCDAASHTFFLPVDMEDDVWEDGVFGGAFADTKAELFFIQDFRQSDKKNAIAKGQSFSFLAVSKKGYGEYQLVFTGLPMLMFRGTADTTDDGSLIFEMTLLDTEHTGDWVKHCYTKSRLRGNTSLTYEKKSLRLYLKEKEDDGTFRKANRNLLDLRNDDDWILNSLYADNSRIRDQLCIELWNEVGANSNPYGYSYGTDACMVEVLINDAYQGIYSLMVPIDAKQLGLERTSEQYAADAEVVERLYKKKYTREWISSDFIGELPDADMPDYRGGFYLKGDAVRQNEEEWSPLYRLAKSLEADDETFAQEITVYQDRQNLIENWLFYQAIAGFDNQNKNYYYVVKNKNGRDYGYFIPWDMNISFGMVYAENEYYSEDSPKVVSRPVIWEPAQRMIELDADDSKALLAKTWKSWRSGVFSDEAVTERIRELEHRIKDSGAFAREDARYPNGNQREDFSYIYEFAIQRMAFVDEYVNELVYH